MKVFKRLTVYVASSWRNARHPGVVAELRARGWQLYRSLAQYLPEKVAALVGLASSGTKP